jgi:hypothetical protein
VPMSDFTISARSRILYEYVKYRDSGPKCSFTLPAFAKLLAVLAADIST